MDSIATASEKKAVELLKKRGLGSEQAEKAVAIQGFLAPSIPISKVTKTAKTAKLDKEILDWFSKLGKNSVGKADDVVYKLKDEAADVVEKIAEKVTKPASREEVLNAKVVDRLGKITKAPRYEELLKKPVLTRLEQKELEMLEKLFK